MIIGLSGKNCSGKDTVANYLLSKGFVALSLSDAIREDLKRLGRSINRENLIAQGNYIRQKYGEGELVKRVMRNVDRSKNYVIISIRNPGEAFELANSRNFFLVDVVCDQKLRFERMKSRMRESDPITFEKFCELEKIEASNSNSCGQQLDQVSNIANFRIENNSTIQDLNQQIDSLLAKVI